MGRRIELVAYNSGWPNAFTAEAEKIAAVLGEEMISIHHIGSTAIPGIKAKPVIDLLSEVRDIHRIDTLNDQLTSLGYEARGEFGIPGRRYFHKQTHHLHIFQTRDPEYARHLNFRDYLRAHPDAAQAYNRLKEELVEKFSEDRVAYTEAKTPFIRDIEQRAKEWKEKNGS